mgnify:CR=1 FL=1
MKVLYPVCTIFVLKIDIPMDILFLVGGLLLILLGANGLTDGAASVAKRFHIPSIVIGLTIVAFGTSAPELTVSISSALKGSADIAIGNVVGSNILNIFIILVILLIVKISLDFLLKTEFGFALRALGDNDKLVVALGINEKRLKIIGLIIANTMVALAGGVLAQQQGFADVGMGTGTIVAGLASIILGEGIFKRMKAIKMTTIVLIGSILYRLTISVALTLGLEATDLKLVTSVIVVIILIPKMGLKEDSQNFLLMHSVGANVSGQIASVIAGGLILNFVA